MAASRRSYLNVTRQAYLARSAAVADNFLSRLRGLLFSAPLAPGDGLYIEPCPSIHMFGMTYAIDCVFLDKEGTVVGLVESIPPGGMSPYFGKASGCLEIPAGIIAATKTQVGDKLVAGDPQLTPPLT